VPDPPAQERTMYDDPELDRIDDLEYLRDLARGEEE